MTEGASSALPPWVGDRWPTSESTPSARADITTVRVDDLVAFYDDTGRTLVMLNPSAWAIWEACDGARTFDDVVRQLSEQHNASEETLRVDVWHTLRRLAAMGLISDASTEG